MNAPMARVFYGDNISGNKLIGLSHAGMGDRIEQDMPPQSSHTAMHQQDKELVPWRNSRRYGFRERTTLVQTPLM
jgi:hypothetical protein